MYESKAGAKSLAFKNSFYLERGIYDLAAVLDESVSDQPYTVKGTLIDLFDPALPVYKEKAVKPGEQAFLVNINRVKDKKKAQVLASAGRVYDEKQEGKSYAFIVKSPINTTNAARVLLPRKPSSVLVNQQETCSGKQWDNLSKTYLLQFENNPQGVSVLIKW
jgi:hypothetical protein